MDYSICQLLTVTQCVPIVTNVYHLCDNRIPAPAETAETAEKILLGNYLKLKAL